MKLHAHVGGRVFAVEIDRSGDRLRVVLDGRTMDVRLDPGDGPLRTLLVGDRRMTFGWTRSDGTYTILLDGQPHEVVVRDARTEQLANVARTAAGGRVEVRAPIPGLISKVLLKAGDRVDRHQTVCCLDAMKLENEIGSPREGVLRELGVLPGQPVEKGQLLFVIE